ncbi:MAG: hypothetical protein GY953_46090, partial [bacterium]|nr:hypothetical protein [bacterium]
AALSALAAMPDPSHDEVLEKATRSQTPEERARGHSARLRCAANLHAAGNVAAARTICNSILNSNAPAPQQKAAQILLDS